MASIQGAGMRIATDLADRRLKIAKELYADITINAAKMPVGERIQKVKELTEGIGPDLVIEAAGDPKVFIEALEMVRKGGTVIEVGNWVDIGETVQLNVMKHISSKNLHIHSLYHCGTNWGPVLKVMEKFSSQFPFDKLISHKMSLEEIIKNMDIVIDPNKCMKVEVVPHKK
jgi:L-iditol 2-dehydrogenase